MSVGVSTTCITFERSFPQIIAYKVLGGEMTLTDMKSNAWALDDLDGKGSLQHPDWQAMYMQFKRGHVLGTVPYRWESQVNAYTDAQLMEVTFEDLQVVSLDGDLFHDGYISGGDKATAAKLALGLKDCRLMDSLGQMGKAALVRETENEWELLVPHCLLPHLRFKERVLARWKRHLQMPVSHMWCDASQPTVWMNWHDGIEPDCIPDVSGSILEASEGSSPEAPDVAVSASERERTAS